MRGFSTLILTILLFAFVTQTKESQCEYNLLANMYTWCDNFSDLGRKQKKNCKQFARNLACLTNKQINAAQLDIFLVTRNEQVLKLEPRQLRKALFFIAYQESKFKYKRGLYDKNDLCYLQVNVQVWPPSKRKKYLLVNYTNKQILNSDHACIDIGLRILLYAYALKTKSSGIEAIAPHTAYLAQLYHAPFDKHKTRKYRNKIREGIKDALD